MTDNPATVTVAVVSWNTKALLSRCLASLRPDQDAGLAEVWVVDNASSDGSAEMVGADYPWVRLIASDTNLGFGPAINVIAGRTRAEWFAIANADTEVRPGALRQMIDLAKREPKVGIVAPRLVLPSGETQHSVHPFPRIRNSVLQGLPLEKLSAGLADHLCVPGAWDEGRPRRVDWAHGAFLLLRSRAFDEIGGFDPNQWMYAEDLDIAWRMSKRGWATFYEPGAQVRHAESAAAEQAWGEQRNIRATVATYSWIARRRGAWTARTIAAVNIVGASGRVLAATLWWRLTGSGAQKAERDRMRWHRRLHREGLRAVL